MNKKQIVGIIVILVILGAAAYYFGYLNGGMPGSTPDYTASSANQNVVNSEPKEAQTSETVMADVGYLCDGGKTVHAVYYEDKKVIIELSDGRAAQLHQTISASGVRYATADESLVFWSKGPTAFVEEAGKTAYANCVELDTAGVEMQ